ncbi:Fus2p NDAI_0K00890 [Naumovozyma dairenensis CBS 421]|uniref:DH domain-containing protein n=1 Tax=Naumovozyma dairenensis (strain ATCC 10597 / BCRC 20456 / CBS 421 / NBRC 0211 / NRRL Y-12639) TaxID=1071378 RepID=G0WHL9_NAUDC|nr:hypothetical protein NDAI_0K00890 [Naumovozyma dairenensis CBS 421]CCD27280.1 hypothetical protein NDAI_0K00890 [Naumovozyma dairenensis CBS 421]
MFKTSRLFDELHYPSSNTLTPIRDYHNDYFHSNDSKLPAISRNNSRFMKKIDVDKPISLTQNSFKRPASLDLSDIGEPLTKKSYSPLNLDKFNSAVNIESPNSKKATEFYEIVEGIYETELIYAELMITANSVYRRALHENIIFRNKLLKENSNEELLLFGNLDTIASISIIFCNSLKNLLLSNHRTSSGLDPKTWDDIKKNPKIQNDLFSTFKIGEVFQQHLRRCKSTYTSYSVSHERQMELFHSLQRNHPKLFGLWYEHCIKLSKFQNLEVILSRPIKRIDELIELLNKLSMNSAGVVNTILCDNIVQVREEYIEFKNNLELETEEYNGNSMYNFSLTPMEIIQSYSDKNQQYEDIGSKRKPTLSKISEASPAIKPVTFLRHDSKTTKSLDVDGTRSNSVFSGSSSYYSGDSVFEKSVNQSEQPSSPIEEGNSNSTSIANHTDTNYNGFSNHPPTNCTLSESITKFKRLRKRLLELQITISDVDYHSILDRNLHSCKVWERMLKYKEPDNSQWEIDNKLKAYFEDTYKRKEEVTILKLTILETTVLGPLSQIIKYCEIIRTNLKDLGTLKKDYILYLKERKANIHDVKRDLIAKHFEMMQRKMMDELPTFISLLHKMIEYIIIHYNEFMMKYLEALAGGEESIAKDLENSTSTVDGYGTNFDILQSFSTSRYSIKKQVRQNWSNPGDPSASRVVRRLFEL